MLDTYGGLTISTCGATRILSRSLGITTNNSKDLLAFQHLLLKQGLRQSLQGRSMLGKYGTSLPVRLFKKSFYPRIYTLCGHLRVDATGFTHRLLTKEGTLAI